MKAIGFKKIAAATLAGTMALSFASCSLFGPNKKEIVEAADTFADTLLKQDADKIIKLTNEKKDSDNAEALAIIFDDSMYSDDQNAFIDAVSKTITYEVDEDSVEVDKEEASADVTFTMVDYEKALDGDFSDIDEVLDALKDCDDTKEVKITFEFEKDEEDWILTNLDDKGFGKLFEFMTYDLDLTPAIAELYDYDSCWAGTYAIFSEVYFTEDISAYADFLSFDVYYEGNLYASAQEPSVYDTYIYCDYYDPDYNDLPAGDYTIVVYCGDEEITSMSTTVEEVETYEPQPTGSFDGDLAAEVSSSDWWLDNGDNTYDEGVYEIELDVYFNVDISNYDITFDIGTADGAIEQYCYPEQYTYSVYCKYTSDEPLPADTYIIKVYDGPESDSNLIYEDYCEVK